MPDPNFWERKFSSVKAGEKPALTIDEMQEKDKPELELQDAKVEAQEGIGMSDVGKAAVSGLAGWGESVSEAAAKPAFTAEQQQEVASQGYSPEVVQALSQNKNLLELAAEKGREWFGENKEAIKSTMSDNARKALEAEIIDENLSFTDDATNLSTWIMKATETVSRMVPDLILGGMGSKQIYNQTFETVLESGLKRGLSQEGARIAADKAAKGAASASTAQLATLSASGGSGAQIRETVENTPWRDLMASDTFKSNFKSIAMDPQYEELSNKDKLNLARKMTADQASIEVQQDPALLMVNAASSFMGDATLGRIIQGRVGGGIAEKALTGAIAEAPTEAVQSAMEQYAQNVAMIDVAGADIDPTKGVLKSAVEGGIMGAAVGGGIGGTTGAVEKVTGREQVVDIPEEVQPEAEIEAVPEEVTQPQKTVTERREALDEKLREQRATAGIGEVQEALQRPVSPTAQELISSAAQQEPIQPVEQVEQVEQERPLTVPERREALKKRLEEQRAVYEQERQQKEQQQAEVNIEVGEGEVQQRLSRPSMPSPEELIRRAPESKGPTPGELEFRRQQNTEYLQEQRDAKIPDGLRGKPNAPRIMNKGYRNAMTDLSSLAGKIAGKKEVSPSTDTITDAIRKMGGLDRKLSEAEGMDPASFKRSKVFPATGGMTFDHAAEVLNEQGYRNRTGGQLTANDVVDMVYGEVNNNERHLSSQADADMLTPDADMVRQWADQIGGADKLSTAINKALAGEKLGKRQADIVEEVIDTIGAIRSEQAGLALETLTTRRDERNQKRVDEFNKAYQEITGKDTTYLDNAQFYEEMYGEMPDTFNEEQAVISELVSNAGDVDYQATNQLIENYDNGVIGLPKLLDSLSEIATREKADGQVEQDIQTPSEPTTQQPEGGDAQRTGEIQEPTAEPAIEPEQVVDSESDPEVNLSESIYSLVRQAARENPDMDYSMSIRSFGLRDKVKNLSGGRNITEVLTGVGGVSKLKDVFAEERKRISPQQIEGGVLGQDVDIESEPITDTEQSNEQKQGDEFTQRNVEDYQLAAFGQRGIAARQIRDAAQRVRIGMIEGKSFNEAVDHSMGIDSFGTDEFVSSFNEFMESQPKNKIKKKPTSETGLDEKALSKSKEKVGEIESKSVDSLNGMLNKEDVKLQVESLIKDKDSIVESIQDTNTKEDLIKKLGATGSLNSNKSKPELADLYYQKIVNDTLGGAGLSLKELGQDKFNERAKIAADNYEKPSVDVEEPKAQFSQDSRTVGNPKGVPVKEAQMLADSFMKKYKGAAGVTVHVFQGQKEALEYGGIKLPEGARVNAYRIPQTGEVVLVAENLNDRADVWSKLRHEILAHHGLFNVVGEKEWLKIMELVSQSRGSKELEKVWNHIDTHYSELNENLKAEEVIAHIAETEPGKIGEMSDRIISAVIRALRKVGLISPGMREPEIRNLIRIVGERIKSLNSVNAEIRNDIQFSREVAEASGFSIPDETRKDAILRSIFDKYQRLKVVQKSVKEQGGRVTEGEDVYLAEELFHGKVGEDLRQLEDDYVKPLQDLMSEKDIDAKELDLFLIAKHAPERNAHIAEINEKMPDGGSGMTNAESAEVISKFEEEGRLADMEAASKYVYDMLANTRQRLIDSGLETIDAVESWESAYKNYVPLKGFANNEMDEGGNVIKATGRGFSVRGKETMKAMGRRTMAESPLAYAISDSTQSMIRARKNEVGQTLLKLVDANPDPELWQVFSDENPDIMRRIVRKKDPITGKMKDQVIDAPAPMFALKDKYLGVKMNGEQYFIKLNDERLMSAMANLGVEQVNLLTRTVGRATRFLSALITSYNPEFALSNLARDVQTAMYNVMAEAQVEGGKAEGTKKLASQMAKDVMSGKAFKVLKRGIRDNDFSGEWGSYMKEYLASGAKTGWFVQKDIEEIKNDIQKSLTKTGPGAVNKFKRGWDKFFKFVDDYNDVVENASRLSVYVNGRKQGLTEKQAASLAKNLTVNFNRRGEMTNNINALYMFFNASVQGTANMLRAVATPRDRSKSMFNPEFYNTTQKIAMMLIPATMGFAALNRSIGGEDDDGTFYYDKIPDYIKETNFVMVIPGSDGDYIKIPMPYGYNFFAGVGHAIDKGINGDQSIVESAFDLTSVFAGAFSPLGAIDSDEPSVQVVKTASPAILKPFVELAVNENFSGSPIYKEQNPYGLKTPDSYNSQRRTWEWAKGFTEWLNDATGGNEFKSGYVDIAPESIQHLTKFVGGGTGTLLGRTQDAVAKAVKGEEIEGRDVPFWRKYFGNISSSVDIAEMYKRFDEVKEADKQLKGLPKKEVLKYRAENMGLVRMIGMQKSIEKSMRELNKRKREIESSKLSEERKKEIVDRIEERKKILATKFNKKFNDLVVR